MRLKKYAKIRMVVSMNIDELFIEGYKLPEPLAKDELDNLLKQSQAGSKEAKEKITTHNIRLVLHEIISKFKNVDYDKKDLVSIGAIGLLKAIDTYDISKGYKFSSYATTCIDNEILMFIRKLKGKSNFENNIDSLNRVAMQDKDGNAATLQDQIRDDKDFVEDNERTVTYNIIRKLVNSLPDKDREIIMLYFGFDNDQTYTQREIAHKMNMAQSMVSRIIVRNVEKIGKMLEFIGVIEEHFNQPEKAISKEEMPTKSLALKNK